MSKSNVQRLSRRDLLKNGTALAAAGALGAPAIAHAAEPIKVGMLQPFSGGLEALGEQGYQGAKLAIDEANDKGGLLNRPIEYIRADDKTDPKTAVERTLELIQRDHVDAIMGPVTSANRDAIMPTIDRFKTPLLYATDYEGGVCNRYITCYSAVPEQWVNPLIRYVREHYGDAFFLVGSNYIWPQKMNAAVNAVASQVGARTVGEEYVPFGNKDFTSILRKVESASANVLVNTVVGADAITLVKQFTAAGLKPKVRIVFFGFSENYIAGLTNPESNGIVTISNFISSLDKPEAKEFVKKVRDRYGPNTIVSNTTDAHYNLMRFYFGGIERAQSTDKEKVTDAMVDQWLQSGNGRVYLRPEDRHVDLNVLISEVENGVPALKKDIGRVDPPNECQGKSWRRS
jgi:branched-chain amino acid transport system substrate-binding protein/urea transport system substrate-binding protein